MRSRLPPPSLCLRPRADLEASRRARAQDNDRIKAMHQKVKEGKERAKLKYKESKSKYRENARA